MNRVIVGLTVLVLGTVAGLGIFAFRSEDTRGIIEKSPCYRTATDPDCQKTKAETDRVQALPQACIQIRKTIKPKWLEIVTRCDRKGVVPQNSQKASQPSGPSEDGSSGSPGNPPEPGERPSKPPSEPPTAPIQPPVVPPIVEPDPPVSPPESSGVVENVLDTVCQITNRLGVCIKFGPG